MEEILALQAQLMRIQDEKPKQLLSERNAMEILNFLKNERKMQIVSTIDGKEFMTLDYLDNLIYETCQIQKKIRVNELENILNVSADWISSRIENLVRNYNLTHQNNQLMTQEYIQLILLEISDILKNDKICYLADFAFKQNMEIEFMISFIENPQYKQFIEINFTFDSRTNVLISNQFYKSLERKMRGILNGSTLPLSQEKLIKLLNIDQTLIGNFLNSQKYKLQNNFYCSEFYTSQKQKQKENYFLNNGIVNYNEFGQKFLITKPISHLKQQKEFDKGLFLEEVMVQEKKLKELEILLIQILNEQHFAHTKDLFPYNFNSTDHKQLVQYLMKKLESQKKNITYQDDIIYSVLAIKKLTKQIKELLLKQIDNLQQINSKKIENILIEEELLNYNTDSTALSYIAQEINNNIDLQNLKKNFVKKNVEKPVYDIQQLKLDQIEERGCKVLNYFLLFKKFTKATFKKATTEDLTLLNEYSELLQNISLSNMILVLCKKFNIQIQVKDLYPFESKEQYLNISHLFVPIFNNVKSLLIYAKMLPKDIKQSIFNIDIPDVFSEDNQVEIMTIDLEKILLERGPALTLGQFQIQSQKKQEKKFLTDLNKEYINFKDDQDHSEHWQLSMSIDIFMAVLDQRILPLSFNEDLEVQKDYYKLCQKYVKNEDFDYDVECFYEFCDNIEDDDMIQSLAEQRIRGDEQDQSDSDQQL